MRVYGVTGRKNSGKTTLIERLVTEITARGFSVSTVKHAHHDADIDQPGRDSYRHREAGAQEVLLATPQRWALLHELHGTKEPDLAAHVARLSRVDLVLVEGFKRGTHPKIEALRAATGTTPLAPTFPTIRAIASDHGDPGLDLPDRALPVFDLDDIPAIADFIVKETGLDRLRRKGSSMPPGVDWTPVGEVLERLKTSITPIENRLELPLLEAAGHVLAEDAVARRNHPPAANSAVDGYGYAFGTIDFSAGPVRLAEGRAAAGVPFAGAVPAGQMLRILTGAALPEGVDTVLLQEHARVENGFLTAGRSPKKPGENTRRAGEDMKAGQVALKAGAVLRGPDIGLAAALGIRSVTVRPQLRVGVLSTGEELIDHAQADAAPALTPDANRPMLLSVLSRLGYVPVDLGITRDDRGMIRSALNGALGRVDAILTSGGASQGDEDHVSRLLREEGQLQDWRVAMKPGRPVALAKWQGVPVFGLPGNPVAAMVCTMVFALPALSLRAGAGWREPQGFEVPANFAKIKQAGRREYLRARLTAQGWAEVFPSEGSGRISGLSWADGLVELSDEARDVQPGDRVRFIPWTAYGF